VNISRYIKQALLVVVVLCTSCSSASQTAPKAIEVDDSVNEQALSIGIENFEGAELSASVITFYVTNNSSDDVRMLVWGTPFEQRLSADILMVSVNDKALPYLGRMVKRGEPTDKDYIVVPAGERLDVPLDLAISYGVSAAGDYNVSLKLNEIDGVFMINQETPVNVSSAELVLSVAP